MNLRVRRFNRLFLAPAFTSEKGATLVGRRVQKPNVPPARRVGKTIYAVLVALSAVIVLLYGAFRYLSRPPEHKQPGGRDPASSAGTPAPVPGGTPADTPEPGMVRKEYTYTFLLAATDQASGNTDTMMVLTYDTVSQKAGLVSLPRDTMIDVVRSNGRGFYKLNSMYAFNGIDALREEVGRILGFPIDYYVRVNMRGFVRLVDAVGGIDFYVPVNMSYDDPTQDLHIHFNKGMQWLSGTDALKVSRCRQNSYIDEDGRVKTYDVYSGADIGRTDTQRNLLVAVLKKALSNPQNFLEYYDIFLENVETDLDIPALTFFASKALEFDFSQGLTTAVLPGDGSVTYHGWTWCYQLEPEGVLEVINTCGLNPYTTNVTADMLQIAQKN